MGTQVDTVYGTIAGQQEGDLLVFRGVPFAAPPVGKLRLRAPQPPESWEGVRPAVEFGLPAPQVTGNLPLPGFDIGTTSEDCLYLNVWTPGTEGSRPVMVWIHGGAFVIGAGSQALYDGTALAGRGDVVVVTINYRLGALGFLNLGEDGYAGNAGLLDQIAALEWVRDNIAAFGGDPDNVTIFGESAGGMSVGCLLGSPKTAGLFRRAIPQSGSAGIVPPAAEAADVADRFLAQLDLDRDRLAELADIPVDKILEAQQAVTMELQGRLAGGLPFQPFIDGDVLPESPIEHIRAGGVRGVDILVGTCRDEWKLFAMMDPGAADLDDAALLARLGLLVPDAQALVDAYRADTPAATPADIWGSFMTDRVFRLPGVRLAETQVAFADNVYAYLFTWESPAGGGMLGACHALELPFVFGTLASPGMAAFAGEGPAAEALAEKMQDAWLTFARTGQPASPNLPAWPRYDTSRRATMVFGPTCEVVDDPGPAVRQAWRF